MDILIKQAKILEPGSSYHGKKRDILIKNGCIDSISTSISKISKSVRIFEGKDLYVSQGWVDLFADFCEPGYEQHETLNSGINAAAAGGYSDVCLLPNTNPVVQSKAQVEFIRSRSGAVRVHPIGAISKNLEGKDLAEMFDMRNSGAIAFSDGRRYISNNGLMMKALQYVKAFNGLIIELADDTSLSKNGLMHEGIASTRLGLAGKPDIAEHIAIQRSLELLQYTSSKIHFTGVSTKKGMDIIRQAKKKGAGVSCSVNIHHLLLTDEAMNEYNSVYKINPPLRTAEDRKALIKALEDGTIDTIASHHIPANWDAKQQELEYAKEGMIALQIMLPLMLQVETKLKPEEWISLFTTNPAHILQLKKNRIEEGNEADLCVFSTTAKWLYSNENNLSLSENSPYLNTTLKGRVIANIQNENCMIFE